MCACFRTCLWHQSLARVGALQAHMLLCVWSGGYTSEVFINVVAMNTAHTHTSDRPTTTYLVFDQSSIPSCSRIDHASKKATSSSCMRTSSLCTQFASRHRRCLRVALVSFRTQQWLGDDMERECVQCPPHHQTVVDSCTCFRRVPSFGLQLCPIAHKFCTSLTYQWYASSWSSRQAV